MLLLQQTQLTSRPYKFSFSSHSPLPRLDSHHSLRRRRLLPSISCCAKPPSALRTRSKKKKTKSNEELCGDIRDFVSAAGFPQGYLPSYKDFSLHGRQDLANIVRRRGYKLVRELLASSMTDVKGSGDNEITEEQFETSATESGLADQGKDKKSLDGDASFSSEFSVTQDHSSCLTFDHAPGVKDESRTSVEESTISLLQEKAAKFIQNGELETVEGVEDGNEFSELPIPALAGTKSKFVTEEQTDLGNSETHTATALNGNSALSSKCVVHSSLENGTLRMEFSARDELASAGSQADLDIETRTKEDEIEVKRIKFMLHQKELELSHLKQEIEKEKQALAELQIKAEAEISKARQLILDKDTELQAAEESLAGLKEVQIEYFGDGENVEVAGSFNGWHQRIKMDPQPFSNIKNSGGLRNSRLWRSVLWLYPGRYEIKFIVDGEWKVDPQRETVNFGNIHNNILHVPK